VSGVLEISSFMPLISPTFPAASKRAIFSAIVQAKPSSKFTFRWIFYSPTNAKR